MRFGAQLRQAVGQPAALLRLGAARRVSAASSYDADATALFARMSVQPDATRKGLYNNLYVALKAAGVYAKCTGLWLPAAHDAQAARLNLIGTSYTLTDVGAAPTFTTDRGFQGNGSTQLLDTGLIPGSGLVLRDNHHMSVWPLTEGTGVIPEIGAENLAITARLASTTMSALSASATGSSFTVALAAQHTAISRNNSANVIGYKNGVSVGTVARASAAFPGVYSLYLCGRNATTSGGGVARGTRQTAAASIGGYLDATEMAALYAALNNYLVGVGAV